MNTDNLVDLVYAVGGFFSLNSDRSGFEVTVPHDGFTALMREAVSRASEILPILCEQVASRENLAEAFAALPVEEREMFADFPGGPEWRALQAYHLFASSQASELIASAKPRRRKSFADVSRARARKVSQ
jgi:hypothetical protein